MVSWALKLNFGKGFTSEWIRGGITFPLSFVVNTWNVLKIKGRWFAEGWYGWPENCPCWRNMEVNARLFTLVSWVRTSCFVTTFDVSTIKGFGLGWYSWKFENSPVRTKTKDNRYEKQWKSDSRKIGNKKHASKTLKDRTVQSSPNPDKNKATTRITYTDPFPKNSEVLFSWHSR